MPSDPPAIPDDTPGDPSAPGSSAPGDPAATGPTAPERTAADVPGDPAAEAGGASATFHDGIRAPGDYPDKAPAVPSPSEDGESAVPPEAPPPDAAAEAARIPEALLRIAEAVVFASATPVPAATLAPLLPVDVEARAVLQALADRTAGRGVRLTQVAGGWAFRTAPDLAPAVTKVVELPRRLPRAAMEALAIIAWHQPATRPEIEEIRGTSLAQTTLEVLLENGLIAPRGKKEAPGRPTLWGTTPRFLDQFGLNSLRDLPRREELLPEPGLPFPPAGGPSVPGHAAAPADAQGERDADLPLEAGTPAIGHASPGATADEARTLASSPDPAGAEQVRNRVENRTDERAKPPPDPVASLGSAPADGAGPPAPRLPDAA